jgi:mannosyltransferase OCH1-like enzyme
LHANNHNAVAEAQVKEAAASHQTAAKWPIACNTTDEIGKEAVEHMRRQRLQLHRNAKIGMIEVARVEERSYLQHRDFDEVQP